MSDLSDYSINCDYLRDKFDLPADVNLYKLVNMVTDYVRSIDDEKELVKLTKEENVVESLKGEEECLTKPLLKKKKAVKKTKSKSKK